MEIFDILNTKFELLKNMYGEDRILGVYVYGNYNYGTPDEDEGPKVGAIYLPTLEQMCLNTRPIDTFFDDVFIKDLRLIYSNAVEKGTVLAEALYTKYYIINPRYEKIYDSMLRKNRVTITDCNKQSRLYHVAEKGTELAKEFIKWGDKNKLSSAYGCYLFCKNYEASGYERAFNLDEQERDTIKRIRSDYYTHQQNIDMAESLLRTFISIRVYNEDYKISRCEPLIQAVMSIMSLAINDSSALIELVNKTTILEKLAMKHLLLKTGEEGNVSIAKITEESGCSRQVYQSLFSKLRESGLVEVTNMGVKGTHIKVIDPNILTVNW